MRYKKYITIFVLVLSILGLYLSTLFHVSTVLSPIKDYQLNQKLITILFSLLVLISLTNQFISSSTKSSAPKTNSKWLKYIFYLYYGLWIYVLLNGAFCLFMLLNQGIFEAKDYWFARGGSGGFIGIYATATLTLFNSFLNNKRAKINNG